MTPQDLESALDRLYNAPLPEFITVRNDIVKGLKSEGRKEEAATVQALRKPSVAAWTVNQLSFSADATMRALVQATTGLAEAHGRVDADLPGAIRDRREHLDRLTELAKELWTAHGIRSTKDQLRRLAGTLEAATQPGADPRPGRLSQDLESSGFGVLSGLQMAVAGQTSAPPNEKPGGRSKKKPGGKAAGRKRATDKNSDAATSPRTSKSAGARPPSNTPSGPEDPTAEEATRLRRARAAAEQALATANARAERLERLVARAEADAGAARRRVDRARAKLVEMETRLEQARADVDEAQTQAGTKDEELDELRADRDAAQTRAQEAREALDSLVAQS